MLIPKTMLSWMKKNVTQHSRSMHYRRGRTSLPVERLEDRTLLAANLSISKTGPTEVIAGETITYTISVFNDGPDSASGITVVDTLPPGLTYLGDTNPNGSTLSGSTLTFDIGDMADNEFQSFQVKAMVAFDYLIQSATDPHNEVQTVTLSASGSGLDTATFRLTFLGQTTAALAKTSTAAQVQTALEALSTIGAGNVAVTGNAAGPYTVTFQGALANQNVAQLSGQAGVLAATVVTTVQGDTGTDGAGLVSNTATVLNNEVQFVDLLVGAGTFTLTFDGQTTAALAFNATATQVQTALENLSNLVPGDVAVTVDFAGGYIITFQGTRANRNVPQITATGFGGAVTSVGTLNAGDTDLSDNRDTVVSLVGEEANLVITKFVVPFGTVRTGEVFIYTIHVDNLGPSAARNVLINDSLLNSSVVSIQSCAFSVSQGGGAITQFTCTTVEVVSTQFGSDIGTFSTNFLLPVGEDPDPMSTNKPFGRLRASFRLVVNDGETASGTGGAGGANDNITITNVTRVSSDTPDPDLYNNVATADITVLRVADLAITMTATAEEQQSNQSGLMFNNAVFGQDFPTAPNYFASTRVTAGRRIKYELVVTNTGPSDARNVVVSDLLPAGVKIYQGSLKSVITGTNTPRGTFDGGTPGEPLDRLVVALGTLDAPHPMANPAAVTSVTITFEVIVDASTPAGDVIVNAVNVTSDTLENDNSDNQARTEDTVLAAADLVLFKTSVGENIIGYDPVLDQLILDDVANQVTAGRLLRYQISVQNNGPSDAQHVVIQDLLPAFVTFVRAVGADVRPDAVTDDNVFASLGTLEAGERRTFDIYVLVDVSVPPATILTNSITALTGASNVTPPGPPPALPTGSPIQSPTWDPQATPPANTVTSNTTVNVSPLLNASANLAIVKDAPDTVELGTAITYTVTVKNNGLKTAKNVVVEDFLPVWLRGVSYSATVGGINAGVPGDALRPTVINLGTLLPGHSETITVEAIVRNDTHDLTNLFNDARVSTTSVDSDSSDNVTHSVTTALQTANGNVRAYVSGGTVYITGDKFNNKLVIEDATPADPNAYRITPLGGTRINGQFESIQLHGARRSVVFNMGSGNDTLLFPGPLSLPRNLNISLGHGDDTVDMTDVTVAGNTTISSDGEADTIDLVDSIFTGSLTVRTGAGEDTLNLSGVTVGGNTLLSTDGEADTIDILDSLFSRNLTIRTGAGDDTLTIATSQVSGRTSITTDGDDDSVTISNSIFEAAVTLKGGNGVADFLDISIGNSFASAPVISGFEP